MKSKFSPAALLPAAIIGLSFIVLGATAAEKWTIKDIMKNGHKGDDALVKKVTSGGASDADKKQLLEYYQSMARQKPPQGSEESWKTKTDALIKASQQVVKGDAAGVASLKSASNCKACHTEHKGK